MQTFRVADYESDFIFKHLSTLIVAPHADYSFPADSFLVHKSNIQILNQHIKIGYMSAPGKISSPGGSGLRILPPPGVSIGL